MPSFEQHCVDAIQLFGEPFEKVHRWLDEFAGRPPHGMRHRKFRHHQAGIDQVRRLWGDEAAESAKAHIIADLKMEGWTEDQPFPQNEEHCKRQGGCTLCSVAAVRKMAG
ncbi:MAG: hypothetical protein L0387_30315 [Acidobacteria bacterium]|nr:hypothetical protein [Acidobacteriota bacterium]